MSELRHKHPQAVLLPSHGGGVCAHQEDDQARYRGGEEVCDGWDGEEVCDGDGEEVWGGEEEMRAHAPAPFL